MEEEPAEFITPAELDAMTPEERVARHLVDEPGAGDLLLVSDEELRAALAAQS